ncbi:MAG: amidohydrolase [Oscillospiraceae bacterium]|nr:amidohydrolase [Oscillospiraceae bacterium]
MIYKSNEECYPHADDVLEREFADDGFSKGWAMHCKPVPEYYFDSHIHYGGDTYKEKIAECVRYHAGKAESLGAKRVLIMFQIYGRKWNYGMKTDNIMDNFPYFTEDEIKKQLDGLFINNPNNNKYYWAAYMNYQSSEEELVHASADMGACFIKLHNAPIIEDNAPFDIWYSKYWQNVFGAISERKLPVLWHVTQRFSSSLYTNGGRNVYWKNGWKNGVIYTNEDLLQVFLTCCRRYPDINFIGAHQIHIGWDRLGELFTANPNLYVDTTIGCQLRLYDNFYPHDKEYLRSVFIRWADRIIFGTDTFWGQENTEKIDASYRQHMRFIASLDLPQDVLDKICHGNIERLCHIPAL